MANFDPARPYSWPAVTWAGTYAAPTDPTLLAAATVFDTTGFANAVGGVFGWSIDAAGGTMFLTYTPVPEPSTPALAGIAAVGLVFRRRRRARRGASKPPEIERRLAATESARVAFTGRRLCAEA